MASSSSFLATAVRPFVKSFGSGEMKRPPRVSGSSSSLLAFGPMATIWTSTGDAATRFFTVSSGDLLREIAADR